MKKLLIMVFAAGVMAGCMPTTRPAAPNGADAAKKKDADAAEGKLTAVPPVTRDSFNQYTYDQKGVQALADELDRDEKKPVNVVVQARK